jgi:hypothetical protein
VTTTVGRSAVPREEARTTAVARPVFPEYSIQANS